jgi:hypothetical protein
MKTLDSLKKIAQKKELRILKFERGEDSFIVVDKNGAIVSYPTPLTLEQLDAWFDDDNSDD